MMGDYRRGHVNKGIEAKQILGYVPETAALFDSLTVEEHINFIAKAYRLKDYEDYAGELFERFDLSDKTDKLGKGIIQGHAAKGQHLLWCNYKAQGGPV